MLVKHACMRRLWVVDASVCTLPFDGIERLEH